MLARPPALVARALLPVRAVERAEVRHRDDLARAAAQAKVPVLPKPSHNRRQIAYNKKFAKAFRKRGGGASIASGETHADGRGGHSKTASPSLSISDGGRHPGSGTAEAYRGHQERQHQRILFSGPFPRQTRDARRIDH